MSEEYELPLCMRLISAEAEKEKSGERNTDFTPRVLYELGLAGKVEADYDME